MATRAAVKRYHDRVSIVFYPSEDPANGVNASISLTLAEVRELIVALEAELAWAVGAADLECEAKP